jgi:hypothetical protein
MNNTTEIDPAPFIGRTLAETELLITHLKTAEIGQVITYDEMKAACKEDVQTRNTILQTARRTLLKPPHRMVFGTVAGIGIKRLSDDEIPDVGAHDAKRAVRIARNSMKKLGCADVSKMTGESKVRLITTKTVLGLFTASGSRKVRNLAEQSARVENGQMKIGDVTSLFAK